MIHPLFIIACVLGAALIVYLVSISISIKEKRSLKKIDQSTWNDSMEHLYGRVDEVTNNCKGEKGDKGDKGDEGNDGRMDIQRDWTGDEVYGGIPPKTQVVHQQVLVYQQKTSLLLRLFGKNFQSKSKADKEHWVKLYDNGSRYTSSSECYSSSEVYISSKGFMVTVNNHENSSKNKPKFYFDLVKEGDDINTTLLTVEESFHKLSYIVSAILDGKFKPSSSPYDKYWLELERVKVNEIVSDHQMVVDFFDKLDQRWYEYSVMYNDTMSGVVGFTPYASKLSVGDGDELQGFIKKMKLNNSLMSLLGTVEDDEIIESIILDRYNVEVDVDRSAI